jgi:hypothetical protein
MKNMILYAVVYSAAVIAGLILFVAGKMIQTKTR